MHQCLSLTKDINIEISIELHKLSILKCSSLSLVHLYLYKFCREKLEGKVRMPYSNSLVSYLEIKIPTLKFSNLLHTQIVRLDSS